MSLSSGLWTAPARWPSIGQQTGSSGCGKRDDGIDKLKISYPFILVTGTLLAFDNTGFLLLSWTAIVFHEIGHLLALWRCGRRVEEVSVRLTGLRISYSGRGQTSYGQDLILALAGPLANFLLAGMLVLCARYVPGEEIYFFIGINVLLGAFNLLPALPMDGGRVLEALLSWRLGSHRATTVCGVVGAITGGILALLGVWVFVVSKGNYTLLVSGGIILVGLLGIPVRRRADSRI